MDQSPSNVLDDRDEFELDDRDEFFQDRQVLYFQTYEQAQYAATQLRCAGYNARVNQLIGEDIMGRRIDRWMVEGER